MGLPGKIKYNCILVLISVFLSGCSTPLQPAREKELVKTGFAFNTTYTITLYVGGSESLLEECVAKCQEFEKVFSRTLKGSELYNINEIEKAYLKVSDKLDINDGNVFIDEKDRETAETEIKSIADPGNKAVFHLNNDGSIEFGVSDILYEILEEGMYYSEISDGVFDITAGPESSLWDFTSDNSKVPEDAQIKDAVKLTDRNEIITAVKAEDTSVVSSGIYERYFIQDGKIYHHILDTSTGYPYDNGLVAVTIISVKSVDGDALSTTCFAMGLEKGLEFVNSLEDVYAVFITEDERLHYSEGFKEMETGN